MSTPRISARPVVVPTTTAKPEVPASPAQTDTASAAAGWQPTGRLSGARPTTSESAASVAATYFEAFSRGDAATMAKQYAPNATFDDPIYSLRGQADIGHMWTSLLKTGKNLKLSSKVLESNGDQVKVAWTADYTLFGRKVHNESVTTMQVKDGKITSQKDDWSWSKWAKQAFPLGGLVDFKPVKSLLLKVLHAI